MPLELPNPQMPLSSASETAYRMCARCVMDTSDPQITFDAEGVCNHCHAYLDRTRHEVHAGDAGLRLLTGRLATIKNDGAGKAYDCVIGVSGGVDSTYVAWKVKSLGLRPLAVHLDNGWDSEIAVSNISTVLKQLGIDLHTEVLDWEEFRDIQLAFLRASTPDAEIPSDHAIFASLYRTATKIGVRHVITGLNVRTETHMPTAWSNGHYDWGYIKAIHNAYGSGRRIRSFPHYTFYEYVTGFRHSCATLNILDYLDYSKSEALLFLQKELGWRDYGGKHHESVYTRWYQGVYLPRKFGFDKRRSHLSSRICSGEVTREAALAELAHPSYDPELQKQDCEYVAKKLGLSSAEFDAIMTAPTRRFEDFPSFAKMQAHPWFRRLVRIYQFFKFDLRGQRRP
jgi:N-acetyl sugar amidotransferase